MTSSNEQNEQIDCLINVVSASLNTKGNHHTRVQLTVSLISHKTKSRNFEMLDFIFIGQDVEKLTNFEKVMNE